MKLDFKFTVNYEFTRAEPGQGARAYFLRTLERARANPKDPAIPAPYLAVLSKHPEGTDEDVLLTSIMGEIVAAVIQHEVVDHLPPASFGLLCTVTKVQYQEGQPPLPVPEGVQPLLLEISRQHG